MQLIIQGVFVRVINKRLFEGEGSYRTSKGYLCIAIVNRNRELLDMVKICLDKLRVKSSIHPHSKGAFILEIYRQEDVKRFLELIKPCIKNEPRLRESSYIRKIYTCPICGSLLIMRGKRRKQVRIVCGELNKPNGHVFKCKKCGFQAAMRCLSAWNIAMKLPMWGALPLPKALYEPLTIEVRGRDERL